ncbi:MAG TPA: HdeD family acid-resistance protein [Casimicrobiaceae bacterium]|nr:HdeD family acid-resistance protein [Casimicrobiaceae bacterium]
MSTTAAPPSASTSPGWSLALGILLVIAGVLALVFPVIAAVTAALYIGWFALIAGVIALVVAIRTRNEPHLAWRVAVGVLYLVLGFLLVANPIAAAASLAIVVGALMAASGVVEIMLALRYKPRSGWGWLLAGGVLSIVLAILIAIGWPLGSLVLIGYLVGIQIIACGVARIAIGSGARKSALV